MCMKNILKELKRKDHPHVLGALDIFKYIGPGLLVTVGFIDPGNWASNFAAGSEYGYTLLWVVTLSTIMLIALQHNVAHLGIVTGLCLSEAAVKYAPNQRFPFAIKEYLFLFTPQKSFKTIKRIYIYYIAHPIGHHNCRNIKPLSCQPYSYGSF